MLLSRPNKSRKVAMLVSQKSQYALRAIYELARQAGKGPVKISNIADAQAIPARFLEVILYQLKCAGLVDSKRGYHGGYELIGSPDEISVGDIFKSIGQNISPVQCLNEEIQNPCPFYGNCAFLPMWRKVQSAILNVCNKTTVQDLLTG